MLLHGAQEVVERDAGAPTLDVGFVHAWEQCIHLPQRDVDHLADRSQWMVGLHEVLQLSYSEQALGQGVGCAHFFGFELD